MLEKVRATITRYAMLRQGDGVVVGVSGGPDSVALLHVLRALSEELRLRLHVAHLNHLFRGAEAAEDAAFVERLAGTWDLPVTVESYNVPALAAAEGLSAQAAARRVRYEFFRRVSARVGAAKVAVGHHADDQAETVLMHLLKGTGLPGLAGMAPVRGEVIRPLLEVARAEIEDYCREHHLASRLDCSNVKTAYLRNRIRLSLMPVLKEYNPRLADALNRLATVARDEDDYLEGMVTRELVDICLVEQEQRLKVSLPGFLRLADAIKRRIIRRCYVRLRGEATGLSLYHVETVLLLAQSAQTGGEVHLPGGIRVRKGYTELSFQSAPDAGAPAPDYLLPLQVPGETALPGSERVIRAEVVPVDQADTDLWLRVAHREGEAFLDYDQVSVPLYIRPRRPGDRFMPLGMPGTKKLQDFLIDVKVPRQERERIPLVVSGEQIVWVAGWRPDERFRVNPATRRMLHLSIDVAKEDV